MVDSPKTLLLRGVSVLAPALGSEFAFELREEGRSRSGDFAWGEFVRGKRRLELHFTCDLGPVRYWDGELRVSHARYMHHLGAAAEYPGFRNDPFDGFAAVARDLRFASDFLSGDAAVLRRAAVAEASDDAAKDSELMASYVGDNRARQAMRMAFREGRHADVIAVAAVLKYPERLAQSEQRMLTIARSKVSG